MNETNLFSPIIEQINSIKALIVCILATKFIILLWRKWLNQEERDFIKSLLKIPYN